MKEQPSTPAPAYVPSNPPLPQAITPGASVAKVGGDYTFEGIVVSVFHKLSGQPRCVVEDNRGILHIFNASQLEMRYGGQPADGKTVVAPLLSSAPLGAAAVAHLAALDRRLALSPHLKRQYPNHSACGRCQTPWPACQSHSTMWDARNAIFPLCEDCWQELGTPAARIPYYEALLAVWNDQGPSDRARDLAIIKAVEAGG